MDGHLVYSPPGGVECGGHSDIKIFSGLLRFSLSLFFFYSFMPPKRRTKRTSTQPARSKRVKTESEQEDDEEKEDTLDSNAHEIEEGHVDENEDDEDDEEDWEAVDVPEHMEETAPENAAVHETMPVYNDVEIVMEAPRPKSR